jgi:hypothetical protein
MLASLVRLYRRLRFGAPIVVVSGLPRSGTSMLMKMIEAGGLPLVTDGLRTADEDNPKGYYELERVKNLAEETDKGYLQGALDEVLASQKKMLERRAENHDVTPEKMRELFQDDLWRSSWLLKNRSQFEALDVHYTDILAQPLDQARKINAFLGGGLNVDAMAAAVDPQLYRNRAKK